MSTSVDTAVVTIVRGRAEHLHRQRIGLAGADPGSHADLHVVVGMGEQPELHPVPGAPPVQHVPVAVAGSRLPLAAARNAGVAAAVEAGARLLVLLDVDCIPGPRLVRRYAEAARTVTGPALLCGPVSYLPPPPPGGYPTTGLDALAEPHPARPAPPDGEVHRDDRFALFWSLSFAVTATDWARFGGFCEDYTGYGAEDTDFAAVAARAGAGLHWVGGAHAHHQHHPPTRTTAGAPGEIVANAQLFRRRHGWWPMSGWLDELAAAGRVVFDPDRDELRLLDRSAPTGSEASCGSR